MDAAALAIVDPLAFLDLVIVAGFAIGWAILEYVANRADGRAANNDQTDGDEPPSSS